MEIYKDYLSTIKSAMAADKKANPQYHNFSGQDQELKKGYDLESYLNESKKNELLPSLQTFADVIGLSPEYNQMLGAHPDFSHLKHTSAIEKHFVVSMFIDIKKSTRLFAKYDPETVFIITNTIQRAAIHTNLIFGGYIQRLHGDGLFVYFGGKNDTRIEAAERALQAASVFTHFVSTDLKELFNNNGVETIFTRIGIDYGEDADVVWAMAGMGQISEITTCSLHTSLASKMQNSAESNGIVVGDNIKSLVENTFYEVVSKRTGNEKDRYIFQIPESNFHYTQYDFKWYRYLKQLDYIATDINGNPKLKRKLVISDRKPELIKPIAEKSTPYYNIDEAEQCPKT